MKLGKYILVKKSDLEEIYTAADRIERAYGTLAYNHPDEDEEQPELITVSCAAIYIMGMVKSVL